MTLMLLMITYSSHRAYKEREKDSNCLLDSNLSLPFPPPLCPPRFSLVSGALCMIMTEPGHVRTNVRTG